MKINIAHLMDPYIMLPIIFKEGSNTIIEISKKHKNFQPLYEILLSIAEKEEIELDVTFFRISTGSDSIEINCKFTEYVDAYNPDDVDPDEESDFEEERYGDIFVYFDNFGTYVSHEKEYSY